MKRNKLILGVAAPILAAWIVRTKVSSERVPNAPDIATFVKLVYKPIIKKSANMALKGRYIDRDNPEKGRFTQADVNRILDKTWRAYYELAFYARVEQLKTLGNR